MAGDAATEGHPRSAVSVRKVEYGHIHGGKRDIWVSADRTDVGGP